MTTKSGPSETLTEALSRQGLRPDAEIALAVPAVASPVHRGVAHHCYRVTEAGKASLFCKVPADDQEDLMTASAAAAMATLAGEKDVAPPVAWFDPDSAILATDWLEGRWRYARVEDLRQPACLQPIIARLRALHAAAPTDGIVRHDPAARFKRQDGMLRALPVDRPPNYDWLADQVVRAIEALAPGQGAAVPCHLGSIASNIMLGPDGALLLVDFDQAALSEPLHDFGILLTETFDFEDEWTDALSPLFGAKTAEAVHRARLWGLIDDFSWGQWALICHGRAQRTEIEYFKYASWRFMRATLTAGDWSFERRLRQV